VSVCVIGASYRGGQQCAKAARSAEDGSKAFFSEEKKQKTFIFQQLDIKGHGPDLSAGAGIEVFWFFSSEKNCFL
jgi:hypothetical protein